MFSSNSFELMYKNKQYHYMNDSQKKKKKFTTSKGTNNMALKLFDAHVIVH